MSETRTVKLGEIAILQSGIAFPKKLQGKTRGKLPFAKVGDISRTGRSKNIYLSGADNYVDEIEIQQLKGKSVPPGAILFAKIGEAIKQNHRVISKQETYIDNNAMAVVPKNQLVDLHYLYWMLKEIDFYPLASSTTVPSIRKTILEEISISLPSMDEQKRIAQIKNLRHTIDQKRARQRELLSELEKSVFHQMFSHTTEYINLGEIATITGGSSLPIGEEFHGQKDGLLLTKVSDMNRPHNNTFIYSTASWTKESSKKSQIVPAGSIIIPKRGASIATNKKRITTRDSLLDPNLMGITLNTSYINQYYFLSWIEEFDLTVLTSGSSVPQLNKKDLTELRIPFPNLESQQKFSVIIKMNRNL